MAGFVLIHGSWHGGWCFDEVTRRLEAAGHRVLAPTLPGMGGDVAELRAVTLQGWADFAVEQCRALKSETGGPVVLAGHSRGGLVVSQAAETDPAAMDALVYIDALISSVGHGAGTVVDQAGAGPVFAQLSPPELVVAALPRLLAEPHGPRSTPLHLTPERWGRLPRTYVETLHDRTIPISSQRRMQALSPGARVVTLDADHSPYLSAPDNLTAALISAIP
jgi:pimeloyl-ACP methyl ester carboxylesterase